jgi:hypothetical protein
MIAFNLKTISTTTRCHINYIIRPVNNDRDYPHEMQPGFLPTRGDLLPWKSNLESNHPKFERFTFSVGASAEGGYAHHLWFRQGYTDGARLPEEHVKAFPHCTVSELFPKPFVLVKWTRSVLGDYVAYRNAVGRLYSQIECEVEGKPLPTRWTVEAGLKGACDCRWRTFVDMRSDQIRSH